MARSRRWNAEGEHILEQNMIQEQQLTNPLIIWNGYILDGHSRYRILKHHPEIAFEVKEIQLPDRLRCTGMDLSESVGAQKSCTRNAGSS